MSDRVAELVARGLSPEHAAEWAAGEAKSAAQTAAQRDRLVADLAAHPKSPTLNAIAVRDYSGRVVGTGCPADTLAEAYLAGAPAARVVDAERLRVLTDRGRDVWLARGCRLAYRVLATNAALAPYLGRTESGRPVRVLPTVTVNLPMDRPDVVLDLIALTSAAGAESRAALAAVLARDHDPPPLEAAATAPVLRTGPPACSRVRPRQAAPQLDAGTHPERRGAVLAA